MGLISILHTHKEVYAEVRAATADVCQARLPQWLPHCRCAITATAAFHFAKFRQEIGLIGLASRLGPGSLYRRNHFVVNCGGNCRLEIQTWVATISNVTLLLNVVTNIDLQIMTISLLDPKKNSCQTCKLDISGFRLTLNLKTISKLSYTNELFIPFWFFILRWV